MKKTLTLVALFLFGSFLFLGSTVFPFLLEHRSGEFWFASDDVSYWSFKSSTQHEVLGNPKFPAVDSWFCDYWVKTNAYRTGLLPVLASMFLAQILTLITGVVFLFTKRRFLAIAPAILSSMVIALMTYVNISFSHPWSNSTEVGYWLAFPSLFVFLFVFILSYVWAERKNEGKTPSTDTPTYTEIAA